MFKLDAESFDKESLFFYSWKAYLRCYTHMFNQPVSWRMVVDSQVLFEHKYFIGYLSVISVGYTELKAVHTRLIYVYKKNEDDLTL